MSPTHIRRWQQLQHRKSKSIWGGSPLLFQNKKRGLKLNNYKVSKKEAMLCPLLTTKALSKKMTTFERLLWLQYVQRSIPI